MGLTTCDGLPPIELSAGGPSASFIHVHWKVYVVPLFSTRLAFLPPRKVSVPLKVNVLPELEVAVMLTAAVPERICSEDLSTAMSVDLIDSVLVKVYCLAIFEVALPDLL